MQCPQTPCGLSPKLAGGEPHIAGTPGDQRQIKRLRDAFVAVGLQTVVEEFQCVLPEPHAALLEIVTAESGDAAPASAPASASAAAAAPAPAPAPARRGVIPLAITERNLLEDPASAHPGLTYGWNAFSCNGDVTAEVVYANYGTKADFEALRAQGIDVKGKIVLARAMAATSAATSGSLRKRRAQPGSSSTQTQQIRAAHEARCIQRADGPTTHACSADPSWPWTIPEIRRLRLSRPPQTPRELRWKSWACQRSQCSPSATAQQRRS